VTHSDFRLRRALGRLRVTSLARAVSAAMALERRPLARVDVS